MKSIRLTPSEINSIEGIIDFINHNYDDADGEVFEHINNDKNKLQNIISKYRKAKRLKTPKVTTWKLVNGDESHYSCNSCEYNFHLANESSLRENSINFCPSCGYEIEDIIEN